MPPVWIPAFPLERLPPDSVRLFKQGNTQVAVFRRADDTLYAVDNRCPHEGYPLMQGAVSGCTLTCKWHNYKFDLRDGACLVGEEGVRTYPVRVEAGVIEVDLAMPRAFAGALLNDLDAATIRHEPGRIARDIVRLLDLGLTPAALAMRAACIDADHAEFGSTHAIALAAELILESTTDIEPALPLTQLYDLVGRGNVRLPKRTRPPAETVGGDSKAVGQQLRESVEAEDSPRAEAILRGALAAGWRRAEIEPWFFQLCADHFLDFGHPLIYASKIFDALDYEDWASADSVLGGLLHGIVFATREDSLPAWSAWRKRSEMAPSAPMAALAIEAAERVLRFDAAIDADARTMEGWLDVTHRLTFVHAVRRVVARWDHSDARRLTLQAEQFVAMARPLDAAEGASEPSAGSELGSPSASTADVVDAVRRFEPTQAIGIATNFLARERSAGRREDAIRSLTTSLENLAWSDHATRAIFLAHHVKTLRAGRDEAIALGDDRPMLAAIRFLASRLRERNIERSVKNAIALVRHGKPPTTLT